MNCDVAIIYGGDLPDDWCLVPVEKIDGYKGTDFKVGCVVLHLLDSSIFSSTEWPSCDLIYKNKQKPFNNNTTLDTQPEKRI